MTPQEIDRIECAIRHIESSLDVDPWATEIAVEAMQRDMPKKLTKKQDEYSIDLLYLYCPTCGSWVGIYNVILKRGDMFNNANRHVCPYCGQSLLLMGDEE
jgi:rubrerythrin